MKALSLILSTTLPALAQQAPTLGLVAHYQFNGNATDEGASGYHGTVLGALPAKDRRGITIGAYSFNGTTQFISLPAAAVLNGAAKTTISIWILDSSTSQTGSFLGTWNEANGGIYLNDYIGSSLGVAILPNGQITRASTSLVGDWHHLVIAFDGTRPTNSEKLRLFIDGSIVSPTIPYPLPSNLGGGGSAILIGARQKLGVPGDYFLGSIDDLRIYDRALSDAEVAQLYRAETGPVLKLQKAVKPIFSNLEIGKTYHLQTSPDLNTWTNAGTEFSATASTMEYPNYFDVFEWGRLYFRLTVN